MANAQNTIRVLTVTANELMLELIKTALDRDDSYFFLEGIAGPEESIIDGIERLEPDYILLDYLTPGVHPVDIIDSVSLQFPGVVIIVILPEDQVADANRVIMAGARAFIVQPFNQNQLLTVLGRLKELQQRSQQAKQPTSSESELAAHRGTFVIFSPKGGVGCSSVAVNLSAALMEELKQEVLLIDGKLLFGDLDIMLNLRTQNTISDLIPHVGALDESLIRDVVMEHVSGLKVLPAPSNPTVAHGIHPEELHLTLNGLQNVFPHIVVDSGNFLNDNAVTFMDACHKIILVISPDIACLRDASRFFEICRTSLSFPKEKILVVVNQYDQKDGLSLSDIERTLQVKVFATLPWDRKVSMQSINRGVPVVLQPQNSSLRKAFQTFAKSLASVIGPAPSDTGKAKRSLPDVLSKTSRLG